MTELDQVLEELRAARMEHQARYADFEKARDALALKGEKSRGDITDLDRLHSEFTAAASTTRRIEAKFSEVAARYSTGRPTQPDPEVPWGPGKGPGSLGAPPLSFTEQDVASLHKAALERKIETKTITTTVAPFSTIPDYPTQVWPFLRDVVRILDLIPSERTEAPSINYFRATAGATAAAAVAEGANKPESSPTWEMVNAAVRKIAHYARANDEVIADFANFMQLIGTELLAGLVAQENEQLLNGNGTPPNLTGLLNVSGILTRARGTDSNLDALEKAITDLRTGSAFTEPDVMVLHPANFDSVRLSKSTDGQYLTGSPLSSDPVKLWSTRLAVTNRIPSGTALVANLKEAARVYVRQGPTIEVNPMGGAAEFIANQTLIRAEERLTLAVPRPSAIVKVTGLI